MSDSAPPPREASLSRFRKALDFAAVQARRVLDAYPDYAPGYTVGGRWGHEGERRTHGCEGFFPGILWLLHRYTGAGEWRRLAERSTRPLEPHRFDRDTHDLGFLFCPTYLRWYNLTADPSLRQVLVDAGRTLSLRRQKLGYLASALGPGSLLIDLMMNVGLIFWTANETADEALRQVALEHCRATQRYLVRPDGGVAQEGIFDVAGGRFLRQNTHQGYAPESTWSRGLAWSLYGFTTAHRLSGEQTFLETAHRCADYALRHTPSNLVPPWDFDAPRDRPQPLDSSAAAIAASGLWDLSEQVSSSADHDRYRAAALTILETLCSDEFLARGRPEWEGILMHGVYHYPKGLGVDESFAWGDHFFVEALVKAVAGRAEATW